MPLLQDEGLPDVESEAQDDVVARQRAIKQIERRRRFHNEAAASAIGMVILVVIWAMTEYHNAGGWPINPFSQSSGIHDVWNYWIVRSRRRRNGDLLAGMWRVTAGVAKDGTASWPAANG